MNSRFSQLKLAGVVAALMALGIPFCEAGLISKKKPAVPPVPTNPPPVVVAPVLPTNPPPPPPPAAKPVLAWDSDLKEFHAHLGDTTANVTFYLTNTSPVDVVISTQPKASCGCTTAHLPPLPWTLKPGENGKIDVSVSLAGKTGTLIKTVTVDSTAATKVLQVRVFMPDPQVERQQNMEIAKGDRQAVFKNNCAYCHAAPAQGKTGEALFHAVCGVCHESPNRATMVADLHNLKHPTDREFWKTWITSGKPDSLMPAWSKPQGGPLADEQIESLADYLVKAIPSVDTNAPAAH